MEQLETKLKVSNISKTFFNKKDYFTAIEDVSFDVRDGEFLVILGPGRCGKTVLLNIIAGLVEKTSGSVIYDGKEINGVDPEMGMVFQKTALMPFKTVMENVELGLKFSGMDKKKRREICQKYIDLVGLQGFENSYPNALSGGMKQRVGIARAYANNPKLLIMDEPFGALDAQTRYSMQNEVLRIWEQEKRTVIYVTNNIEEAIYLGKVEVKDLTKRFGDLLVLDHMNFDIKKNEFVCVVGPTGCGKTTFLNCLTRIHQPSEGDLFIDGEPADPRKHNISFIFQEPSALPWLTVEENIAYGLKIKKLPKDEINKRVEQIIKLMGLQDSRKKYPGDLSVSVAQRVVIGRSFAMQPDLLLMDEPYGQMDVKMRFYLEDEVIRLWKELGSTVVFITHNIEEAVYLAERVIILSNKPANIKEEIKIDLPHPRNVADPKFIEYREYITEKIKWW